MPNTRDISVRVELYEHAILTRHSLKQGDTTRLIMEVRRGGEPYDLSGLGLLLNVKREDELVYIQTGGYELNRNTVTWTLESPIAAESGHIELEAVLTAESGDVISSFIFRLNIEPRLLSGDEDIAPDDRNEIIDAARAAALSVTQAREARDAAARSAENAQASANAAVNSAQQVRNDATAAAASAQAASDSEVKAKTSQEAAAQSAASAQSSAESAQTAQKGAESAKSDAESSASGARLNADRAETAASAAKSDATEARSAASGANTSAAEARASASSAGNSAQAASDSEVKAKASQEAAAQSAASAQSSAESAQTAQKGAESAKSDAESSASGARLNADRAETAASAAKSDATEARSAASGANTSAAEARASASSAGDSAQAAAQSAANAAKSEAAASAAKAEAETLRDEAVNNINSVKDSAVTVVENVRDTAVSDVNTARDAAVGAVENTGTTAVRTVQEAQNTAVGAVTAEGDTQTARVQTVGDGAVSEIARAGQGALSDVNDAGAAAVSAVGTARDAAVSDVNATADARIEEIQQAGGGTGTDVGAVRFDEAQELTDEQQATARNNIGASGAIVETARGDGVVTVNDSAAAALRGLRLFGKSTQDGTPSPDAPVPIVSVGDKGTIGVSITETGQTLTHATPNGLPGIPVNSGGNYTDASGQRWVCDEVDFGRRVYVRRVYQYTLTGNEVWVSDGTGLHSVSFASLSLPSIDANYRFNLMCTILQNSSDGILSENNVLYVESALKYLRFKTLITSLAEFKNVLSALYSEGSPAKLIYILAEPIETPLTAEQLAAYRALRTQYPTTNIINDEGAGMEVSYTADTKTYIDNKFAELAAAILNSNA